MIIRCVPTMQQASCQVPGWPKMSKQQMCPRTSARSPYSSATRFTAATSHLGAVANSATSSMSRFSLMGCSTTHAVCSLDWSNIVSAPLGVTKR